jgi:hypothetical protein
MVVKSLYRSREIATGTKEVYRPGEREKPLYRHYARLLEEGTKPNLAKLTVARQIASVLLSMWRSEEVYDPARIVSKSLVSEPAAPR